MIIIKENKRKKKPMNASRLKHYFLQIEQTDIPKHTFKGTRDIHVHVHVGSFKNRRKGFFYLESNYFALYVTFPYIFLPLTVLKVEGGWTICKKLCLIKCFHW